MAVRGVVRISLIDGAIDGNRPVNVRCFTSTCRRALSNETHRSAQQNRGFRRIAGPHRTASMDSENFNCVFSGHWSEPRSAFGRLVVTHLLRARLVSEQLNQVDSSSSGFAEGTCGSDVTGADGVSAVSAAAGASAAPEVDVVMASSAHASPTTNVARTPNKTLKSNCFFNVISPTE